MMGSRRSLWRTTLTSVILLAPLLIVMLAFSSTGGDLATSNINVSPTTAKVVQSAATVRPNRFPYGVSDLRGASPEEIGQYAQEYASANRLVRTGTPTVLLSTSISRDEYTALGLGCLPDFAAIEQPPLVLVILKGDLELPAPEKVAAANKGAQKRDAYAAYVFDVWSGLPVALQGSFTGSIFRKALKDSTLPTTENWNSPVCPTQIPSSKKTTHYGEILPGSTTPPPLREEITSNMAPPMTPTTQPVPPPIPTEAVK